MADPGEGVTPDGLIRTGVRRERVSAAFEPVLTDAVSAVGGEHGAALFLYGSVATGTTDATRSDVDLLAVGFPPGRAADVSRELSAAYVGRCRSVDVAGAAIGDLRSKGDEAYGYQVFLRHYCLPLAGPAADELVPHLRPAYSADARAARGFHGDLGHHLATWRRDLDEAPGNSGALAVRLARKTLLALAGLISVHDSTWTTDRARAAGRWSALEPQLAAELARLLAWSASARRPTGPRPTAGDVARVLADDGVVGLVTARFADLVGMWEPARAEGRG